MSLRPAYRGGAAGASVACAAKSATLRSRGSFFITGETSMEAVMPILLWVGLPVILLGGGYAIVQYLG
jgi:hypothetical protein